jgi:hypothetical protein
MNLKLPLSFDDYQRLYQVIATVLDSAGPNTAHACKFFAIAGAYILTKTHGLKAFPRFGSAFFLIDGESDSVIAFTDMTSLNQNEVFSHPKAFHAWIECEGVMIDLMVPHFRENLLSRQPDINTLLPRKMFQKTMTEMSLSPFKLLKEGDFYLFENPELTTAMITDFFKTNMYQDLAEICLLWYTPTPKPISSQFAMQSEDGINKMQLSSTQLTGVW